MREKSYQDGLKLGLKTKKPLSAMAKEYRARHSSLRIVGNEVVEVQDVRSEEQSPDEDGSGFGKESLVQTPMKEPAMSPEDDGLIAAMQASRDKANLTKEQKSKMACFQFVYKGTCNKDRDCEYLHARPILEAYMDDQAKRFTNSPFLIPKHREIASRTPSVSLMKAPDQRHEARDAGYGEEAFREDSSWKETILQRETTQVSRERDLRSSRSSR
jgi:hypothetical protein